MSLAEILTRKKRSSAFLNLLLREKRVANNYELSGPYGGGGGGATGVLAPPFPFPHRRQRSTFLLISNLKQSEVGEDKTVYICQKSVITMKNQVRPVCSPKDKIWSRTDKLQRCRRLPLEQAKLRQILENNSEGVLIRK